MRITGPEHTESDRCVNPKAAEAELFRVACGEAEVLDFPDNPRDRHKTSRTPRGDLEAMLGLYHEAAGKQAGVFVLSWVNPLTVKPRKVDPKPKLYNRRFAPGDIQGMAEEATGRGDHSNVYFGPALMRSALPKGSRGKESDIECVLALVLEEDADKGELVTLPDGLTPSFIIESSHKPALNKHFHLIFDRPLPREEAVELAKLALRKCGGDTGGGDVTHIWRLPNTKNFPDWKKIEERGRPPEPQAVRLIGGSRNRVNVDVLRRALVAMPDPKPDAGKAKGKAQWQAGCDTDRDAILARLSPNLRSKIATEAPDRSKHTYTTMLSLFEEGLRDDEVLLVATGTPFAKKYEERGDLSDEIGRLRASWQAKGGKLRKASAASSGDAAHNGGDAQVGGFTEDGLALEFAERHQHRLRYVNGWKSWMSWDGTKWKEENTLATYDFVRGLCRAAASAVEDDNKKLKAILRKSSTVGAVETLARSDRKFAMPTDAWDKDDWMLNSPGGIINLRTGQLMGFDPKQYMTKITEVTPTKIGCPKWLKFLDQVTDGNSELTAYLKRCCGYWLTGSIREHALWFIYGPGGNGKGVFINTVTAILSMYHIVSPAETFAEKKAERHPTELARLNGARLVISQETEQGQYWAEARIKSLTGGDRIPARFMRGDYFEFDPKFKLCIVGNHKPQLRAVDDAIRRRFNMIPFDVDVKTKFGVNPNLSEELKTEYGAIMQWMVEGCLEWQENGLQPPECVLAATNEYLDSEDTTGQWIADMCVTGATARDDRQRIASDAWETNLSDLFESWKRYANFNHVAVKNNKSLGGALVGRGFKKQRDRRGTFLTGIRLKTIEEQEVDGVREMGREDSHSTNGRHI